MRQTRILTLVLFVGLAGCGGGKKKTIQAEQLYQFGTQKLSDKSPDPEGAVADLTQASKLDPDNAEIEHALGLAYWAKARLMKDESLKAEAEKHMVKSFELKKGSDQALGDWHNNLGALYVDMQRWPDAVIHLEKALKDPEYRTPARPLNNLSKASLEQRKWKEAEDYADRALRVQPGFCMALIHRGYGRKEQKKYEDALGDFLKVTKECPEYPEAWLQAGVVSTAMGKKNEAKKYFLEAKRIDPEGEFGREADKLLRKMGSSGP